MNGTAPKGGSISEFEKPGSQEFSPDGIQSAPLTPNVGPCVSQFRCPAADYASTSWWWQP
jgi:hypothetical protein